MLASVSVVRLSQKILNNFMYVKINLAEIASCRREYLKMNQDELEKIKKEAVRQIDDMYSGLDLRALEIAFEKGVEALQKELDEKEKHIRICHEKIMNRSTMTVKEAVELQKELDEAMDILNWYAEGYGYTTDDSWINHIENGHMRMSSGKRAREFLAKVKKE
jgi:hypothetical protein